MRADKLTLERIFDRTERLEVPLFQRPYVWKREGNWLPLWEAIQAIADKRIERKPYRPHFLGTVVLDQIKTPTGKIHARQLIDGQQRLTTLQLSLAAARDLCTVYKLDRYAEAFKKLTDNYVPLSENAEETFKVWPTNADREDFKDVMLALSPDAVRKLPHADPDDEYLIPNAYLFFSESFGEWINAGGTNNLESRIETLYATIREDMLLVVIDLEENDDAQEIFETLNALGTPLLPADLVKNHLFHLAEAQGLPTQKLYEQYWKQFDGDKSYWRQEVRQGRLKKPRLDHFLGHYLVLRSGAEVIATQLFSAFKDYVGRTSQSAADHMMSFKEYADVYQQFDNYTEETREGVFFWRLDQLDTTTVYPLLLEIFKALGGKKEKTDLLQMLIDVESFFVRRGVCELTPKNYNRLFADLIGHLRDNGDFGPHAIRQWLLTQKAETSRWPDDAEFQKSWFTLKFYKRMKKTKTRMILEALEESMRSEKTEKITLEHGLTIEHLLPQEWEKHWPISTSGKEKMTLEELKQRREDSLHRIGNLTLLTKKLNPSVSNGPWAKKREQILKHSALNLNRKLQDHDTWGEEEIESRSKELFEHATKIWPYPKLDT